MALVPPSPHELCQVCAQQVPRGPAHPLQLLTNGHTSAFSILPVALRVQGVNKPRIVGVDVMAVATTSNFIDMPIGGPPIRDDVGPWGDPVFNGSCKCGAGPQRYIERSSSAWIA